MDKKTVLRKPEHLLKNHYKIELNPAEEGGYNVVIPELPGCFTQGDTYDEAINNASEAIKVYIPGELQEFWNSNFNRFNIKEESINNSGNKRSDRKIVKELYFG